MRIHICIHTCMTRKLWSPILVKAVLCFSVQAARKTPVGLEWTVAGRRSGAGPPGPLCAAAVSVAAGCLLKGKQIEKEPERISADQDFGADHYKAKAQSTG